MFSSTCILIPRTQHGLHDHQGNWIWICPRSSAEGNRKLCKGNIIINYPNLNCHTKKKEGRSRSKKENESCWKDHNIKETKWCTSEPVKTAGSFATNSEAVVGSVDNLVKSFFTCSTISSCLTAPAAAITWKYKKIQTYQTRSKTKHISRKQNDPEKAPSNISTVFTEPDHSRSCIMSWNVVLQMCFSDCLYILSRSQYRSPQRSVLESSRMQMIKNNFFSLSFHLHDKGYKIVSWIYVD